MKPYLIALLLIAILLAACAPGTATPAGPNTPVKSQTQPSPASADYSPRPDDANLTRGPVYLDSSELLTMESMPLQFSLQLKGNLPTPCHKLRVAVKQPDRSGNVAIDVYSVVDPSVMCTEVLQPFETTVPLGSFPSGHYKLLVNGEQVAEFDA